jgi:uncharacterized integral membrane protein (TIGR00698 family)
MYIGTLIADLIGIGIARLQGISAVSSSPVSGVFIAILLGLLIRNFIGLHHYAREGVSFSIKFILKFGIILLGIRLSFIDVVKLGAWGIPIIITCIVTGLLLTIWITNKMSQPHRLGTLMACGTGICGVTAILAISPGIKANEEEVAYAIGGITLFGIISMFLYPYLAHFIFQDDPIKIGLFLGTAIHDTAQVTGASLMYNQIYDMPKVIDIATITKLTRNVFIIAVVPLLSYYYINKAKNNNENEATKKTPKLLKLIPLFVIGFLLMSIVRTIGDAGISNSGTAWGLLNADQWKNTWTVVNKIGTDYLLGMAMAAVGLSTSFKIFKGIGMKPLFIGLTAALSVGIVSILMVNIIGGFITL